MNVQTFASVSQIFLSELQMFINILQMLVITLFFSSLVV